MQNFGSGRRWNTTFGIIPIYRGEDQLINPGLAGENIPCLLTIVSNRLIMFYSRGMDSSSMTKADNKGHQQRPITLAFDEG